MSNDNVEFSYSSDDRALHSASLSTALLSVFRGKFCDILLRDRNPVSFEKHAVIYEVGDNKRNFFFIRHGFVKVGTIMRDGREIIYDIRKEGDVAGELCVTEHPRRDRAVALEQSKVIPVGYAEIVRTLQSNPDIITTIVKIFCDCLADAYEQINALSAHDILPRVADVLFRLASKMGLPSGDLVKVPTYLTQEEISHMVAARRERVSTALNILRRRGVIQYSETGHLLVRVASLKTLAE